MEIPALQYIRTVGTYVESAGAEWRAACKRGSRAVGKSAAQGKEVIRSELTSSEVPDSGCREKPLLCILYPYRKPTQVDEERILRPTGEALLRNSAK